MHQGARMATDGGRQGGCREVREPRVLAGRRGGRALGRNALTSSSL